MSDAPFHPRKLNLKTLLKLVVSLGLLAFFFQKAGLAETMAELSQANLRYLLPAVGIYLVSQYISAYRWKLLANRLGFYASVRELFDYYMLGMFFSLFLPGSIGGDVGRVVYLAKSCERKKREAMLTVLADRGVGLVSILIFTAAICATPYAGPVPEGVRAAVFTLSGLGLIAFIALQFIPLQRLTEKFPKLSLLAQAEVYWLDYPLFLKTVFISFAVHCCMVLINGMIASALGIQLSIPYLMIVYGLVSLVSVTPIFFNGIGIREGAYQFLLTRTGVLAHTGLAFGVYWFAVSTLTSLIGGAILVKGHYKTPTSEESEIELEDARQPVA